MWYNATLMLLVVWPEINVDQGDGKPQVSLAKDGEGEDDPPQVVTSGNHKNYFISSKTKYRLSLSLAQKHKIQSLRWQAHEQKTQKLKLRKENDHFPVQNQKFTYTQT